MAYHLIKEPPSQQPRRIGDPFKHFRDARAALLETICFGPDSGAWFWIEDDAGNMMTVERPAA